MMAGGEKEKAGSAICRPLCFRRARNSVSRRIILGARIRSPTRAAVVWLWNHDPFGNGDPTGAFSYELRFPGQIFDQSTKLRYNYFRDYDPRTGRYIESDQIGLQGGIASSGFLPDIVPLASLAETGSLAPPSVLFGRACLGALRLGARPPM
jgi:RHS repeat-associated protein